MRELYFENQGTNTYLVYEVGEDDEIDTMSVGMLTHNKIPGLATVLFTQMNTTKYIKYNVSAKISVNQFFTGAVNGKRLIGVFSGIVDAMLSAEDYMMDSNAIVLDLDYIFSDVSTCETILICLPVSVSEQKNDIGLFFKNIMFSTQFEQTENCDYVAKIINYLNSTPIFSLPKFKKLLDDIKFPSSGRREEPIVRQPIPLPQQSPPAQIPQKFSKGPPLSPSSLNVQQKATYPPIAQANPALQLQQRKALNPQVTTPPTKPVYTNPNEKPISWFYLMQHYNADNAAKYKAQKAAKKNGNVPVSSQPTKPQSPVNTPQAVPAPNVGFAIPSQPAQIRAPQIMNQQKQFQPAAPLAQNIPMHQQSYAAANSQGQSMNFGETMVLGGGETGGTMILNVEQQQKAIPNPYLIREKNNEKIMLNKPVFRIGKEKSYVDYFISDNTSVSRSHANIITRDDKYFILDTNSTNHTFLNGKMLQSNTEFEIVHGTTIRLANEVFEFKVF